jgi:GH18 family chitinase
MSVRIANKVQLSVAFLVALAAMSAQPLMAVDLIGYVPYYRMNATYNTSTLPAQLAMLDEVRYFGLTAASNGSIVPLEHTLSTHLNNIATIKSAIEALPVADRPRLNITLGAAGQDASFTAIAPSASLRATFAVNIKNLLDQTGATSVDIDWEGPDACCPNPSAELTTHYPAMLKRIKQEVGANRRVYATIESQLMLSNSVFTAPNAIDGVSLMTYDLGWWGNDDGIYNGEHSLPEYVADATEAWTEPSSALTDRPWVWTNAMWGNNVPAEKLGIGLPFYSHSVTEPDVTHTFFDLVAAGTTTDGNYYTIGGRSVWLPGPALAAQRVQYAYQQGLQHLIIWELGQDVHPTFVHQDPNQRANKTSLLRAAFEAKLALHSPKGDYDGDGDTDANDYIVWMNSLGATGKVRADGNGDQVVDAADYILWRKMAGAGGAGGAATSPPVPEPSFATILIAAALLIVGRIRMPAGS